MSSPTWTPDALSSSARALRGDSWRFVEAQHRVSTLKLVDSLPEQALLEELIETAKPPLPEDCRHLHYLLATPFRYGAPYPVGSRFRRAGMTAGVFYASTEVETAAAESAFHQLLFFAESPETPWPRNPREFTAFKVAYRSTRGLDLTAPPLQRDREAWCHPTAYETCQALADSARQVEVEILRYQSVRDPEGRANLALLTCRAFAEVAPSGWQSWRLHMSADGLLALCDRPGQAVSFPHEVFSRDPRLSG